MLLRALGAEIIRRGAERDHEHVVRERAVVGHDQLLIDVDKLDHGLEKMRLLPMNDLTDGLDHLMMPEPAGRHLVEHGREEEIIRAVDDGHLGRVAALLERRQRAVDAGEPCAENHYFFLEFSIHIKFYFVGRSNKGPCNYTYR